MPDQKPPRLAGDARTSALALLQYQRESFVRKVEGLDEPSARRVLVPSGTTILWLTNHMADAEGTWVIERFSHGRTEDAIGPHGPTLADAVDRYRAVWPAVDGIIAATPDLATVCPPFDDQPAVDLWWIVLHLIEETARHAGHVDILREQLDGLTGR